MKKMTNIILFCVLLLTLTACGKKEEKTQKSSSKIEVSQSSTQSEKIEEDKNDVSNSSLDIDMAILKKAGYTVPENIKQYVGTYSASGQGQEYGGTVIELSINSDGSYRKLTQVYTATDESYQNQYGYFDASNNFQVKTFSTAVGEKIYFEVPNSVYTQGVVVEKFGDLYLVDLAQIEAFSHLTYLNNKGEVDILFSLLRGRLESNRPTSNRYLLPTVDMLDNLMALDSYAFSEYSIDGTPLELTNDLSSYGTIKDGQVSIDGLVLTKNADVHQVVQKSLSELLTQDYLDTLFTDINALYQTRIGKIFNEGDSKPIAIDLSKVYKQNGQQITPKFGVSDGDGETAYVLDEKYIYHAEVTDGKYIIRD